MRSMNIAKTLTLLAIALSFPSESAFAQSYETEGEFHGIYHCQGTVGGGLLFDEAKGTWYGGEYDKPETIDFKIELIPAGMGVTVLYEESAEYMKYNAFVESEDTRRHSCDGPGGSKDLAIFYGGQTKCSAMLRNLEFNFRTGRFLNPDPVGFLDGDEDHYYTPMIIGGFCKKL